MQACQNQNNLGQSIFEYPQRAEFLQNNWYEMISILILVLGWNSELSMNSGHLLAGGEFLCKMLYLIWKYTYTKFNQPLKIKRQNSFNLPIFTFTKLYMLLDTEYNKTNQIPGEN